MIKLKTLKDLLYPKLNWNLVDRKNLCSRRQLKKEVIKWIIELEKDLHEVNNNPYKYANLKKFKETHDGLEPTWITLRRGEVMFAMNFFNISRADIKATEKLK